MSIYAKHKDFSKYTLVVYEDTKGKTRYKTCKSTLEVENTCNGQGYYVVLVQYFIKNGYHDLENNYSENLKIKKDYLMIIIDKLLELFN